MFVTTSTFTVGAREYVDRIQSRVVMIDGTSLAELMIRYRVAVRVKRTCAVVEVDEDYFEERLVTQKLDPDEVSATLKIRFGTLLICLGCPSLVSTLTLRASRSFV